MFIFIVLYARYICFSIIYKGDKMKKILMKTIMVLLLILCTAYQTIQLWSYNVSDREEVSDILNITNKDEVEDSHLITPNVLSVYFSEENKGYAIIKKTNLNYDNLFNDGFHIIT